MIFRPYLHGAGVYILNWNLYLFLPFQKVNSPSLMICRFFYSYSALFALVIPYFSFILPLDFPFSLFLPPLSSFSFSLCQTRRSDVRWHNIRGWIQIVSTPYDLFSWNKYDINLNIIDNLITFEYINKGPLRMLTLHAGSSSSRLTLLSFFLLLHVASFLAGSWLLILLLVWGALPSLPAFPWVDPISLRSQATPYPSIRHTPFFLFLLHLSPFSLSLFMFFITWYFPPSGRGVFSKI